MVREFHTWDEILACLEVLERVEDIEGLTSVEASLKEKLEVAAKGYTGSRGGKTLNLSQFEESTFSDVMGLGYQEY
jgi:hypothetical protein